MLWLAASKDSRVSIWTAKWSQDFCELVDWLSFPTPPVAPDGKALRRGGLVMITLYNGLYRDSLPKRGTLFRLFNEKYVKGVPF